MKVLVTGANGFIGKNLISFLSEKKEIEIFSFSKDSTEEDLVRYIENSDFIFHLAGVNRPSDKAEFAAVNAGLTEKILNLIKESNKKIPIIFSSSTQVELENEYGISKSKAEQALLEYSKIMDVPVYIFRMPNVFGKWTKPNYNSVVATFCHNIARSLPIQINDPNTEITLVYIDDLIYQFWNILSGEETKSPFVEINPKYKITLKELADLLYSFRDSRKNLITERVGTGLARALYSTYMSYLEPASFVYEIPNYIDQRGVFVEMLKTKDSGQFSFFTAHPGITRGSHYHHSKSEKFLVIKGKARFGFRHILTNERHEIITSGDKFEIVETIPGWTHDITNIGSEEMIVMLWANEIFDRSKPDTYSQKV